MCKCLQACEKPALLKEAPVLAQLKPTHLQDLLGLHLYQSLDSTQAEAQRFIKALGHVPIDCYQTHVFLAEHQTKGQGRYERCWVSPFAENIYLTFVVKMPVQKISGMISIAMGLRLAECLTQLTGLNIQIKWPNDLIFAQQKLGGILIHTWPVYESSSSYWVCIGVGLNVNMQDDAACDISQPWISLSKMQAGTCWDRNQVAGLLIAALFDGIADFREQSMQSLGASLQKHWLSYDAYFGKVVELLVGDHNDCVAYGRACGIDEQGQLQLQTRTGMRVFSSGELAVKLRVKKTETV